MTKIENEVDDVMPLTMKDGSRRLFIGVCPSGLSYCDRARKENGDYKKVAYLSYLTLELRIYNEQSPLVSEIAKDALAFQARRGEFFATTESGHGVKLGGEIKLPVVQTPPQKSSLGTQNIRRVVQVAVSRRV